jgi:hypothetical protein
VSPAGTAFGAAPGLRARQLQLCRPVRTWPRSGGGAVSVKIDPLLWRFGLGGNGFPEGARSAGLPYSNAYAGAPTPPCARSEDVLWFAT